MSKLTDDVPPPAAPSPSSAPSGHERAAASQPPAGGAAPPRRREPEYRPFDLRVPVPTVWRWGLGLAGVLLVLGAWALLTMGATPESRILSPAVLPSPWEVARSAPALLFERNLVEAVFATLRRLFVGYGAAIAIGVPVGILLAVFRPAYAVANPLIVFLLNAPVAALIPLTMVMFGIDELQKYVFIFIATVAFVISGTATAVAAVHERYVETAVTVGARRRHVLLKVLIPLAAPAIFDYCVTLFGLAFGYIMLAEVVNAPHGLGALLIGSQRRNLPEHILLILIIIGLLAFSIIWLLSFFGRGFFPWRRSER